MNAGILSARLSPNGAAVKSFEIQARMEVFPAWPELSVEAQGKKGSTRQELAGGGGWRGSESERMKRIGVGGAGDAAFGEDGGDVAGGGDVKGGMRGVDVWSDADALD